jgi:hypothetical protein
MHVVLMGGGGGYSGIGWRTVLEWILKKQSMMGVNWIRVLSNGVKGKVVPIIK